MEVGGEGGEIKEKYQKIMKEKILREKNRSQRTACKKNSGIGLFQIISQKS